MPILQVAPVVPTNTSTTTTRRPEALARLSIDRLEARPRARARARARARPRARARASASASSRLRPQLTVPGATHTPAAVVKPFQRQRQGRQPSSFVLGARQGTVDRRGVLSSLAPTTKISLPLSLPPQVPRFSPPSPHPAFAGQHRRISANQHPLCNLLVRNPTSPAPARSVHEAGSQGRQEARPASPSPFSRAARTALEEHSARAPLPGPPWPLAPICIACKPPTTNGLPRRGGLSHCSLRWTESHSTLGPETTQRTKGELQTWSCLPSLGCCPTFHCSHLTMVHPSDDPRAKIRRSDDISCVRRMAFERGTPNDHHRRACVDCHIGYIPLFIIGLYLQHWLSSPRRRHATAQLSLERSPTPSEKKFQLGIFPSDDRLAIISLQKVAPPRQSGNAQTFLLTEIRCLPHNYNICPRSDLTCRTLLLLSSIPPSPCLPVTTCSRTPRSRSTASIQTYLPSEGAAFPENRNSYE